MGYRIKLKDDDGNVVSAPRHTEGGSYAMGGASIAEVSITSNYSEYYHEHIDEDDGIRHLYGKTGREAEPILREAIEELGTEQSEDYWERTPGNAGHMLSVLLDWAQQHPEATFSGD